METPFNTVCMQHIIFRACAILLGVTEPRCFISSAMSQSNFTILQGKDCHMFYNGHSNGGFDKEPGLLSDFQVMFSKSDPNSHPVIG